MPHHPAENTRDSPDLASPSKPSRYNPGAGIKELMLNST